jgi:hypothetical protein
MNPQATSEKFETWGILEVMGHKKYAGRISERTVGNATFIQIDVPPIQDNDATIPAWSKMFHPNSIFALTPTEEEFAKAYAKQLCEKPIYLFGRYLDTDTPKQLNSGPSDREEVECYVCGSDPCVCDYDVEPF